MSFQEFDELEEQEITPRNRWWWLLKLIVNILVSILTAFGVSSCNY